MDFISPLFAEKNSFRWLMGRPSQTVTLLLEVRLTLEVHSFGLNVSKFCVILLFMMTKLVSLNEGICLNPDKNPSHNLDQSHFSFKLWK